MQPEPFLRRQFLVSKKNEAKLKAIAKRESVSATEIVRRAIEDYDPDSISEVDLEEAIEIMAQSITTARKAVRNASKFVRAGNKEYRERHNL